MRIDDIVWLEAILDKLEWKHAVFPHEVEEVFANAPYIRFVEKGHRRGENVYAARGQTDAGRYLIVMALLHKYLLLIVAIFTQC